jgi:hypothetical protein
VQRDIREAADDPDIRTGHLFTPPID